MPSTKDSYSIVMIGSGKVATNLSIQLTACGLSIRQVMSPTTEHAQSLANKINCSFCSNYNEIDTTADLYIIAVSDKVIEAVAKNLHTHLPKNAFVVHTSGATPSVILKDYFKHYGVFYPLQTFSITTKPAFEIIPICIDASNKNNLEILNNIAKTISQNVQFIKDEQRAYLHVAAVFVNNFNNHLYQIAYEILKEQNLSLDILKPLIQETVNKIHHQLPVDVQTGPAKRRDFITIEKHLKLLNSHPDYALIYQVISDSIIKHDQ